MKPRDFLDVADEWSVGNREAEWRSAISRAYYAAFHVAIDLMSTCGFVAPKGEQAHGYLWLRLSNSGHPEVTKAGRDLRRLRTARNNADYDIDVPIPSNQAIRDVQVADEIIKTLESVMAMHSVLTAITMAMRNYEQTVLRAVTWKPPMP